MYGRASASRAAKRVTDSGDVACSNDSGRWGGGRAPRQNIAGTEGPSWTGAPVWECLGLLLSARNIRKASTLRLRQIERRSKMSAPTMIFPWGQQDQRGSKPRSCLVGRGWVPAPGRRSCCPSNVGYPWTLGAARVEKCSLAGVPAVAKCSSEKSKRDADPVVAICWLGLAWRAEAGKRSMVPCGYLHGTCYILGALQPPSSEAGPSRE